MFIPETQVILTFKHRIGAVRGKVGLSCAPRRMIQARETCDNVI